MSDSSEGFRIRPDLALWLALAVQAVGMGIWIGKISAEVDSHDRWITNRNALSVDQRIAVQENRINAIDRHLEYLDQRLESHINAKPR